MDNKIKVTNMEEALRFYCDIFGFAILSREHYPKLVALKSKTLPMFVELTDKPAPTTYGKTARAVISFQSNNLKKRMAALQAKGVLFITAIGKVGVGISTRFKDPFGVVSEVLLGGKE